MPFFTGTLRAKASIQLLRDGSVDVVWFILNPRFFSQFTDAMRSFILYQPALFSEGVTRRLIWSCLQMASRSLHILIYIYIYIIQLHIAYWAVAYGELSIIGYNDSLKYCRRQLFQKSEIVEKLG